jgi:hypothetical protein
VREAQARKKFKAAQRLEKLKKKSDLLANEEGMTEKEKAQSIAKLLSKAKSKAPKRSVKVVVARGANRGIQGRPKVSITPSLLLFLFRSQGRNYIGVTDSVFSRWRCCLHISSISTCDTTTNSSL